MRTRRMLITLIPTLVASLAVGAYNEPQPHMQAALRILQAAKAAPAMDALIRAKKQLQKASPDKGGHRVRALDSVDHAIRALNAGSQQLAITRINQAIAQIESGLRFDDNHRR